jgi:hypothetical protein
MRPSSSGPAWNAHADDAAGGPLRAELGVHMIQGEVDGACGAQRLPAADLDALGLTEDGEQAVARNLSIQPPCV